MSLNYFFSDTFKIGLRKQIVTQVTALGMYPVENTIIGHKLYSRSNTTGFFENTPSADVRGV